MTRINMAIGLVAMATVAITAGCAGGSEQTVDETAPVASTTAATAEAGASAVDITFTTDPNPVTMGENTFEAMVRQDGQPVTDATVSTEFFMAAMPSMNMAEMRTTADLVHEDNGMYRGNGQVIMAGDWDVTIRVMREGQEIGSHTMTVTAE